MAPKLLFPFLHNCEAPGSSGTHENAANPIHSSHVYHELADFLSFALEMSTLPTKTPSRMRASRKNPGAGAGTGDS